MRLHRVAITRRQTLVDRGRSITGIEDFPNLGNLTNFARRANRHSYLRPNLARLVRDPIHKSRTSSLQTRKFERNIRNARRHPRLNNFPRPNMTLGNRGTINIFRRYPHNLPLTNHRANRCEHEHRHRRKLGNVLALNGVTSSTLFRLVHRAQGGRPISRPKGQVRLGRLPTIRLPNSFYPSVDRQLTEFCHF